MNAPRVHDLIRIDPGIVARWPAAPSWVAMSLQRAPWVVVRRGLAGARPDGGFEIPIGIRGATRAQRFGAAIGMTDVRAVFRPEQLVARAGQAHHRLAAVVRALDQATRTLDVRWGPTGAYGFELATGVAVTHAASDLDIALVEAPPRPTLVAFATCSARIERATGVRIDADVLYADTGIALNELIAGAAMVLAKTPAGPQLVRAPV